MATSKKPDAVDASAKHASTKVITSGLVRFSYAAVFEPKAMEGQEKKKYSVSVLIKKSDKKNIAAIEAAVEAAKQAGKASKFAGKITGLKLPMRDGDIDRSDDPVYAGHMFVTASSDMKPQVVDEDLNPILDREEFYSGCYGRISMNFYPFNAAGNKGVACGLNNIQKLKDGEKLSGGASAEDDFGEMSADNGDDDDFLG